MFTPYPAVTQSDPAQQAFAQMLGGYKPNQLGAGVTLGNPEAQQDYIAQLAQALADGEFSAKQIEQAGSMLTPEFIQNSGLAGVADMVLKTYVGKKMDEKGRTLQADAEARRMAAQEGVDERKAAREAARSDAVSTRERSRRDVIARQMGLTNRERLEFVETGKVPNAARLIPQMTDQGLVGFNPETSEYTPARPAVQQLPPNVTIGPNLSPAERAAAMADVQSGRGDPHGETVGIGRANPQRPLMPYEKQQAPKFQSRQFTPKEVASMGLPAGTVAYSTEDGSPKIVNKPNAIPGGQTQVIDNGDGTQTVIPAGKTTEDQNKAAGWYASSTNALKNLREVLAKDPSAIFPGVIETYAPGEEIKQRSMSPTRQQAAHAFDTMKMDFLHAATGAGFTKEEASDEWRNLAPQRGDDAPLVNQKLRQIEVKLEAMHRRAGGAAPQTAPQGNAAQPDGSPTQRIRIKL